MEIEKKILIFFFGYRPNNKAPRAVCDL